MPVLSVGPPTKQAQPELLGAFHVTWYEGDTPIDSEWLTRDEYHEMCEWFTANGWSHVARYVQRAHLGPEALARLIQDY